MKIYPMSEYDGQDLNFQLLLDENKNLAKENEILKMTLQSRDSLDADTIRRWELCRRIFYALNCNMDDFEHAHALAFSQPDKVRDEIKADFPDGDWQQIWQEDYEFIHGDLTWYEVMEILEKFPKPLQAGQRTL